MTEAGGLGAGHAFESEVESNPEVQTKDLTLNLKGYGVNIFNFPLIMQYNKRDLADEGLPLMSVEEMDSFYNRQLKAPAFAASAIAGKGVNDTLKACMVLTLRALRQEAGW